MVLATPYRGRAWLVLLHFSAFDCFVLFISSTLLIIDYYTVDLILRSFLSMPNVVKSRRPQVKRRRRRLHQIDNQVNAYVQLCK